MTLSRDPARRFGTTAPAPDGATFVGRLRGLDGTGRTIGGSIVLSPVGIWVVFVLIVAQSHREHWSQACVYAGNVPAIVLPECDLDGAVGLAERLRTGVRSRGLPHAANQTGCVTVSVGVASTDGSVMTATSRLLFDEADRALYRAKGAGRDRVERAPATALAAVEGVPRLGA